LIHFLSEGSHGLRQLSQLLQSHLSIFNLRNTRDSVLPEGEEFLVTLYGFAGVGCWYVKNKKSG
jgi:hypothetical protein